MSGDENHHVYGIHAVSAALESATPLVEVRLAKGWHGRRLARLARSAREKGIRVRWVPREDLDRRSQGGRHQGVVARIASLQTWDEGALWDRIACLPSAACLLALDQVTDPRNLGACLRTAAAAGVDAVVIPAHRSAPLNATVRKVASGAAEAIPIVQVTNLARALTALQGYGISVIGTDDQAPQLWYTPDLCQPVIWVLGSEETGIRALTARKCDLLVRIPMGAGIANLNVSVASGVVLFETVRQRAIQGSGGRSRPSAK